MNFQDIANQAYENAPVEQETGNKNVKDIAFEAYKNLHQIPISKYAELLACGFRNTL
jgi:hypothetical protein